LIRDRERTARRLKAASSWSSVRSLLNPTGAEAIIPPLRVTDDKACDVCQIGESTGGAGSLESLHEKDG
jgi:hypothetical protein